MHGVFRVTVIRQNSSGDPKHQKSVMYIQCLKSTPRLLVREHLKIDEQFRFHTFQIIKAFVRRHRFFCFPEFRFITLAEEPFSSAEKLCRWAGVTPRNDESAGKMKSRKTLHGNPYVKSILCQAAWAAVKVRYSPFHDWFWTHKHKLGQKKAIIAVSRKLLMLIYLLLNTGQMYQPPNCSA